jgi:hypothetical protein
MVMMIWEGALSMKLNILKLSSLLILLLLSGACGGGGGGGASSPAYVPPVASPTFEENTTVEQAAITSLKPLASSEWSETSVRKILHAFAFGSALSDAQITAWAGMTPESAIRDMLSFNAIHLPMTPEGKSRYSNGELRELALVWASEDEKYALDKWNAPAQVWLRAALDPELNPFRQRFGLLETNDHMAVNLDSSVENRQVFRYYDDIMNALASEQKYEDVLTKAALSAAVATQYNHRKNKFEDGQFKGNEDFAREFHQLFFGILGNDDPSEHEQVNIRNTAKALTDIRVERENIGDQKFFMERPDYGMEKHYPGDLRILNESISGGNAHDKLTLLSKSAIAHPESLNNLPTKVLGSLADPEMNSERSKAVSSAWKEMPEKKMLALLRSYAISTTFHAQDRIRYYNALERLLIIANRFYLNREERNDQNLISVWELIQLENAPFRPIHDVFGSQKGIETAESAHAFTKAWEGSTSRVWNYTRTSSNSGTWTKDWSAIAPKDADGFTTVKLMAEWLWERFIADGGKNLGLLERSQIYSLLASGTDYGLLAFPDAPETPISSSDLSSAVHVERMTDLGVSRMLLNSDVAKDKKKANERVGLAIAFIVMTPYMFAQEGM